MATGLPVAFVFLLINLAGVFFYWGGEAGLRHLSLSMYLGLSTFTLLPVPMFILMGEVMFRSGVAMRMIGVLDKWLGRLPGRLGLLAVGAGTVSSTMSGSSIATTAMLGALLVPEMEKRGYKKPMSIGPVMGSGGLAVLIPPSTFAVILASVAEISIGRILIAGIVPGLLVATFYASYIIGRCALQPSIAPPYEITHIPLFEKMRDTVRYVLPLGFIILLVLGLIFMGVATPSESAAMGVLGSFILVALYRRLNWELVKKCFLETASLTVMVFIIIMGAKAFGQILAFSGAIPGLVELAGGLPVAPILVIIIAQVVLLFLGMFMSAMALIMIAVPLFMPIVSALGFDPIWFGVLMVLNLEMAMTTPPFGMLLFVMKGVAPPDTTTGDIIRAGLPFLMCDVAVLILIIAFPSLALWLVSIMR